MAKEDGNKLTYYAGVKIHPKICDNNLQIEEIISGAFPKQKMNYSNIKNLLKLQKRINNN